MKSVKSADDANRKYLNKTSLENNGIDNEDSMSNISKNYTVGGYTFKSKEAADEAKNELNAIKYVSAKTNTKDPKQVYLLYNKLLDKELFKTLIGMNYLKDLQQFLYMSEEIPNDKIRPIPINYELKEVLEGKRELTNNKSIIRKLEKARDRYKDMYIKSLIINVVLVVAIIIMIIISMTASNPNVINYERKLQDKYATWQEQLKQQEESLKAREAELNK